MIYRRSEILHHCDTSQTNRPTTRYRPDLEQNNKKSRDLFACQSKKNAHRQVSLQGIKMGSNIFRNHVYEGDSSCLKGGAGCLRVKGKSQGFRTIYNSMLIMLALLSACLVEVRGFGLQVKCQKSFGVYARKSQWAWKQKKWRMCAMGDGNDLEEVEDEAFVSDFSEEDFEKAGVVIEGLNWRVEQLRLEEANKRRFLKAKPVFLPYDQASKWVQAWGLRWETADDW